MLTKMILRSIRSGNRLTIRISSQIEFRGQLVVSHTTSGGE
jgi:hypothetical protein